MKIDKDIYIDVDGTLTREPLIEDSNGYGVRNNVVEFLKFFVDNFENVYWLSANYIFCNNYLQSVGEEELNQKITFLKWNEKYDALDFNRSFYFFDDEIEYDVWQKIGMLKDEIPLWKREPYFSKIDPQKHVMYYVPSDAPMDILDKIVQDIKQREKIN